MPEEINDRAELATRKSRPESMNTTLALSLVRSGNDADLRRALVLARSGALAIGAVRSALTLRAREALQTPGLPTDRVAALRAALHALASSEETEFPFYLEEGLVTVTVPFQQRY